MNNGIGIAMVPIRKEFADKIESIAASINKGPAEVLDNAINVLVNAYDEYLENNKEECCCCECEDKKEEIAKVVEGRELIEAIYSLCDTAHSVQINLNVLVEKK
ncbi:MAG: hypothetical protein IJ193_00150 [Bacilli bacterium]|nr:hypothetical protein [Bacilli bacterium]